MGEHSVPNSYTFAPHHILFKKFYKILYCLYWVNIPDYSFICISNTATLIDLSRAVNLKL